MPPPVPRYSLRSRATLSEVSSAAGRSWAAASTRAQRQARTVLATHTPRCASGGEEHDGQQQAGGHHDEGHRGEARQQCHGQRHRERSQPAPGEPAAERDHAQPGQRQPRRGVHVPQVLGLRCEEPAKLKHRRAEQGRRQRRLQTAQQPVGEDSGQEYVQDHLPLQEVRQMPAAGEVAEHNRDERRRVVDLRLQVCIEGHPAVGVRVPQWEFALSNRVGDETRPATDGTCGNPKGCPSDWRTAPSGRRPELRTAGQRREVRL